MYPSYKYFYNTVYQCLRGQNNLEKFNTHEKNLITNRIKWEGFFWVTPYIMLIFFHLLRILNSSYISPEKYKCQLFVEITINTGRTLQFCYFFSGSLFLIWSGEELYSFLTIQLLTHPSELPHKYFGGGGEMTWLIRTNPAQVSGLPLLKSQERKRKTFTP